MKRRRLDSDDNDGEQNATANNGVPYGSDDPFRSTLQRKAVDIHNHGLDEDGFIRIRISMKWTGNPRIQASAVEDGHTVKFDVALLGPCPDYFKSIGLAFDFHDELYLSLKGAKLERKSTAPKGHLPMALNYPDGVRLKFISRKKAQLPPGVVDYWASSDKSDSQPVRKKPRLGRSTGDAAFSSDWFATPAMSVLQDMSLNEDTTSITSQTVQPSPLPADGTINAPATEPRDHVPDARHDPAVQPPTLPAPPKAVTSPVQTDQPPPPKKLYREVPGRTRKGDTDAQQQKLKLAASIADSRKASDETKDGNFPLQTAVNELQKEPSKHAGKKGAKKAAREAKKVAKLAQQGDTTEGLEHANMRDPSPRPTVDQVSVAKPQLEKPAHVSSPRPVLTAASSTPSNAGRASTSSRGTPPLPPASLSRHTSNSVVPPSTPKSVNAPRASQPERSLSGLLSASQSELELDAGCMSQNGTIYEPLGNLHRGNSISVIAIMASAGGDTKTSTGEWCRRLMLVDPSNVEPDALERGFSVNCFAKFPPGLPQGKQGDVIVLHGMQVVDYQGKSTGTCASYSLWTWAIFVPESGKIVRETAVPSSSQDLGQVELKYCIALGDWWRAVRKEQERRESHVVRHQIGEGDAWGQGKGRPSIAREHRLLKDATPNVHPNGFFDCTVEVLHGHENKNGRVHSVYVTDYTKNDFLTPMSAAWCPPTLAPYVMRIEMWDEAAALAREMQPHEFYALDNVKMRASASGYWEGKFVEGRKMRKLDVDELEGEPHLAELLERKKRWEEEAEEVIARKFPHQLIAEAQLDSHFCCTVEILYVKKKDEERTLAWVTDYTSRTDLAPIDATADWKRGINDDRILKLALYDEQAKVTSDLQPGDVVALRNLRLKSLTSGKPSVTGLLGGFERLIYKLNPQTTGDEGCIALLSRKKAFEKRIRDKKFEEQNLATSGKKSGAASKKKEARRKTVDIPDDTWTVKSMQNSREPSKHAKYKVVARVVDYYPDSIENFVMLRCTNCEDDIPEQLRICTRCETDMSETYVQPYYKFWFDVEDTEGTRLRLVVAHPELRRRQENTQALPDFIDDLDPVDFRSEEDGEVLEKFQARLRTYLGSELVDKHSELIHGMDEDQVQPSDSPLLDLVVTVTPGDKPTYVLWKCALLR